MNDDTPDEALVVAQQQWEAEHPAAKVETDDERKSREWQEWWTAEQERRRQAEIARNVEEFYRPDLARQRRARERRTLAALSEVFVQGIPYM